ncbi:fumarylacetoacetate (FAA) hydrolase [Isosphaera pallida ATCC 43644]|uniref:Fumarylacetoacetate (FAA) hydrolase n=1 Tax=Isosphaera pallida (strain ATCC 43644 / DSM 9630 / IS1B) TaxID=575540 RepID=E8R5T1_ISOPI|nr:fumarylacetoacetate hydrolase family protein [Isosphaera pallida]ADV62838.1 fumarylacetoacetate (FAA) hydrolase [Isosphaera pallida ATCC 43644]
MTRLIKFRVGDSGRSRFGLWEQTEAGDRVRPLDVGSAFRASSLAEVLHAPNPQAILAQAMQLEVESFALEDVSLLPPVDEQEVWGAGVTYLRSKVAREEESERGAYFYDLVYAAERPELFFKATARRVIGPNSLARVRSDSRWTVPEPELVLVITPAGKIVGYTLGDDVSARDIEGANPLYLPQAKVYDGACVIGPAIVPAWSLADPKTLTLSLTIVRDGTPVFQGEAPVARLVRPLEDLVAWLFRDQTFPQGVLLFTGTGIVPPDDFHLAPGDRVEITADGLGTLRHGVAPLASHPKPTPTM